jgi:hypothetical protein
MGGVQKGGGDMKEVAGKITVNLKIIPFGHASIEIKGYEESKELGKKEPPVYHEQKTTNLQFLEITFDGENYTVPQTTGGLL